MPVYVCTFDNAYVCVYMCIYVSVCVCVIIHNRTYSGISYGTWWESDILSFIWHRARTAELSAQRDFLTEAIGQESNLLHFIGEFPLNEIRRLATQKLAGFEKPASSDVNFTGDILKFAGIGQTITNGTINKRLDVVS